MEMLLKNVKNKDLPLIKALAKRLGFDVFINKEKSENAESIRNILKAKKESND